MRHSGAGPDWLKKLERVLGWIAIPNIALILVTLQALGFLMTLSDPVWGYRLALLPANVLAGEYWRLITFLALPMSSSPIWVIFGLIFLYFITDSIESAWGAFKTTLYVLVSVLVTLAFSLLTGFPITQSTDFETSLFLAAAALFPEMEIRLYFAFPVKMKWLGWMSLAFVGLRFFQENLWGRLYFVAIYSNYLVFFGPALLSALKNKARREAFKRKTRR